MRTSYIVLRQWVQNKQIKVSNVNPTTNWSEESVEISLALTICALDASWLMKVGDKIRREFEGTVLGPIKYDVVLSKL